MKYVSFVRCIALGLALLCLSQRVWAQGATPTLAIGWPQDGAVFQKDANNQGRIPLLGAFNSLLWRRFGTSAYRVTATLEKLKVSTGEPFPGAPIIEQTVTQLDRVGQLASFENVDKGWYRLTLKAESAGLFVGRLRPVSASIKVGIGDVFVIGGQSNAQGLPNRPNNGQYPNWNKVASPAPTYDGVRVVTSYFAEADQAAMVPLGIFERWGQLSNLKSVAEAANDPSSGIAPAGPSLWYWARLGELITQRYGNDEVPVAFFNAAWGGTAIKEWSRSTNPNNGVLASPSGGQ